MTGKQATNKLLYKEGYPELAINEIEEQGKEALWDRYNKYKAELEAKGYDVEELGYIISDLIEYYDHLPNITKSTEDLMYGYHLIKDVNYYSKYTGIDVDELDYYYLHSEEYESEHPQLIEDLHKVNEFLMLLYAIMPYDELATKDYTFEQVIEPYIRLKDRKAFSTYYVEVFKGENYNVSSAYYRKYNTNRKNNVSGKNLLKKKLKEYQSELSYVKARKYIELQESGLNIVQILKDEKFKNMQPKNFNHLYYVKRIQSGEYIYNTIINGGSHEELIEEGYTDREIQKVMITHNYKYNVLEVMAHLYAVEHGIEKGLLPMPDIVEEKYMYKRETVMKYVLGYLEYVKQFGEYHPTHKYIHSTAMQLK